MRLRFHQVQKEQRPSLADSRSIIADVKGQATKKHVRPVPSNYRST
jgi:hypothetical protein